MNRPLTLARYASYASPAFALALVGIPVYMHVPKFYTDVLQVDIARLGAIILAVRVLDAVTDPLIGVLSDRTRTRWGRRRPYIAGAAVPLAVCTWFLFHPPLLEPGAAQLWFGAWLTLLFVAWTLVTVPYQSLGPELTFDYHERTRLLGVRDAMLLFGTLVAASMPGLLTSLSSGEGAAQQRAVFGLLALLYAPALVGLCAWCAFANRELAPRSAAPASRRGLWRNRPFRVLLLAYTISALGSNLPAALMLYYVENVLESSRAGLFLALYMVSGVAFLPLWIRLSRRFDKKRTWLVGMAINTGAFVGVFGLGAGDELAYGLLVVLSGVGMGATLALPSSMQADVIDYDELCTGQRREGLYLGVWSIATKLAAGLGVGAALMLMGSVGYSPGEPQSERVLVALAALYALVPSACNVVAIGVALRYPIDRGAHARIRSSIDAGAAGTVDGEAMLGG